jgi:tetratricopeptide (TPR) repeat protein
MDRYLEAFDAAEQARIQGDNAKAVLLYEEAASLAEYSSAADPVTLHHMWGVVLTSLGQHEEADEHFADALLLTDDPTKVRAINRDGSRVALLRGDFGVAHELIDYAMGEPTDDIAERGASMGFKARILLAEDKPEEALEIFGMADVLLQRSDNRHYELYNLMHFLEALVEYRLPLFEDNWAEIQFARDQVSRLRALAMNYGGLPHQQRAANIISSVLAEREG